MKGFSLQLFKCKIHIYIVYTAFTSINKPELHLEMCVPDPDPGDPVSRLHPSPKEVVGLDRKTRYKYEYIEHE